MSIYGGNEFAMKAANHELKGLQAYVNCNIENLYFPLFGLIDYKGWRVIVSSILPIDRSTIIYGNYQKYPNESHRFYFSGSQDAGKTFHDDSPEFREKMIETSRILNIKVWI